MNAAADPSVTLFLCGDVMTGRGVDQILPHPGDPALREPAMNSALGYVELAERSTGGPIPRRVPVEYIWGEAIEEWRRIDPDLKIINLETAVTTSNDAWKNKQVHYRMNPDNVGCLTAAGIDCCVLANNHVLDWGYPGLEQTLQTLDTLSLSRTGAGRDLPDAQKPAVFELPSSRTTHGKRPMASSALQRPGVRGRVLVFGFGSASSGVPRLWKASSTRPGVNVLDETSPVEAARIRDLIEPFRRPGDVIVASIHWGPNWGYAIPPQQRHLAHDLIDLAGVDVIHGHSSHHVKSVEVYRDKPILYGCGDFLTDYEGIRGYEMFRDDLGLMYFLTMAPSADGHRLVKLHMRPTQIRRFQITRASPEDAAWLAEVLNREGRDLRTRVERDETDMLNLCWS